VTLTVRTAPASLTIAIVGVAAYRSIGFWLPPHFHSATASLQIGLDVLAVALVWGFTFVAIQTAMVRFQGKSSDVRTAVSSLCEIFRRSQSPSRDMS